MSEETHVKIVKQMDEIEAQLYGLYRKLAALRLNLQRQWRVLPSGGRWPERSQQATEHSDAAADRTSPERAPGA